MPQGGWNSVVQGLWSKRPGIIFPHSKEAPKEGEDADSSADVRASEADRPSPAASLIQDIWGRRGLLFAHPNVSNVPASDSIAPISEASTEAVEAQEDGHIGGVRGMPKVGLVKLWNKREEIWNKVAETAASTGGGRQKEEGSDEQVSLAPTVETRLKLRNPLRFLGRDE